MTATIDDYKMTAERLRDSAEGDLAFDELETRAMDLVAVARHVMGVACPRCHGLGQRCYPSTSGWAGGIGGATITSDVCDQCWGTGRTDKTGVNLRELRNRGPR